MKVGFELDGSSGDREESIDIDLTSYMFKVTQRPITYFGFPPPEATPCYSVTPFDKWTPTW